NRTNGELADTLGNFIKRSIDFTNARFGGEVPCDIDLEAWDSLGIDWLASFGKLEAAFDGFHFREAATQAMEIARFANRFLTESEPWKVIKVDPEAAGRTMAVSLNLCHTLALLFWPIIPETSNRIWTMLGFEGTIDELVEPGNPVWRKALEPGLKKGHKLLGSSEILFSKIEDKDLDPELKKIKALLAEAERREAAEKSEPMSFKPEITFDDFQKIDLRVARVIACEPVKKANKLLRLKLQVGTEQRQVLSGIAQHYKPEELVGKNVVLVANLADRTIRGELSQGMILAVEADDGSLFLLEPQGEGINGNSVS
ncbi:MAG TPA: methionine--tRNA ligase subunit beta, partial [Chlorobaculum parvum]|nr:methionine--tRNA ligase subunit beta [Chlorobaculum parvum]